MHLGKRRKKLTRVYLSSVNPNSRVSAQKQLTISKWRSNWQTYKIKNFLHSWRCPLITKTASTTHTHLGNGNSFDWNYIL